MASDDATTPDGRSLIPALPPLDAEGVLWVAAIDRVPIEDRIEWVKKTLAVVEHINAKRAEGGSSRPRSVEEYLTDEDIAVMAMDDDD